MVEHSICVRHSRWGSALSAVAVGLLTLSACSSSQQGQGQATHLSNAPSAASGNGVCSQPQKDLDANPSYAALVKAAAAEGTVDWSNAVSDKDALTITKAFHQAFPCITVKHTRKTGDDSTTRLLREMKAGTFSEDLVDISSGEISEYKQGNFLKKIDWKTAFPSIQDSQLDAETGALLSVGGSIKVVAYNTNAHKASDIPDTWEGFLDPKWKGKFEIDSKPKALYQLVPAWGLAKVVDYTKKLAANHPQLRRGESDTMQLVAAGEIDVALGMSYQNVKQAKDKGAPVDFKFIEPVPVSMEQEVVLSGAPHPAAAELLLGWLATAGNKFYDEVTDRGLPFPALGTPEATLLAGKQLALNDVHASEQEDAISSKVLPALGVK